MADELKVSTKKKSPVHAYSIQGRKPSQQDSFLVAEEREGKQLLFVADGVGGHAHGDFASSLCVEIFEMSYEQFHFFYNIPDFLRKTALVVAASVLDKGRNNPDYKNSGTTLCGFFRDNNEYYTINIGDSRMYHYSTNNLRRMTKEHSKIQQLIDSGEITEEESLTHPERTIMTSAIGQTLEMIKIDIEGPFPVEKGDFLMIFSDGVHDFLRDKQIKETLEKNQNSENIAQVFVENAFNAGSGDNITAIVYHHL